MGQNISPTIYFSLGIKLKNTIIEGYLKENLYNFGTLLHKKN